MVMIMTVKKSRVHSVEQWAEKIYTLGLEKYILVGDFISPTKVATMRHIVCGKEFKMAPAKFVGGQRCPLCSKEKIGDWRSGVQLPLKIFN